MFPLAEQPINRLKVTTRDVAIECIPATQRELDNLELLYSARGKRIEQLQLDLDSEREKRLKETRICNHKITLLESEKKNESNILRRVNEEFDQQRQTMGDYEHLISKQNKEIENHESNITVLKEKLESCNIVIEGLNCQLVDLTSCTALSRNNQKQADLLDCINRQFDTDSSRLKAEIQRMSERMDEKMKEIEKLEALMDEQTENHRIQKHEWKIDLEALTQELSNEKECRKELEYSTGQQQIDHLNNEICDLHLGKSLVEDMNEYLQQQVSELSHQIVLFEQSLNTLDRSQMANTSFCLGEDQGKTVKKTKLSISCPLLPIVGHDARTWNDDSQNLLSDNSCEMRQQIFVLIARTNSLTNRLLDLRKVNLDSKGQLRKLQKTCDNQQSANIVLQVN